jgi:4-hydroxy-3-methylbut-2-enyl diphosphate reductase
VVHDTICAQVANRHQRLLSFAREHDIILFVSGRSSSNGKVLSDLCRGVNPRTYVIGGTEEINPAWFRDQDRVGICGATSTPKWLLEEVANAILRLP